MTPVSVFFSAQIPIADFQRPLCQQLQSVQKSPELSEGLFLMDGIEGLRSLSRHSVDMLLTDPPYGTIATTYIRPYKVAAGKTAVQTMEDRFA